MPDLAWSAEHHIIMDLKRESEVACVGRFTLVVGKRRSNARMWTWQLMDGDGILVTMEEGEAETRHAAREAAIGALLDIASREYADILEAVNAI